MQKKFLYRAEILGRIVMKNFEQIPAKKIRQIFMKNFEWICSEIKTADQNLTG